MIRKNTPNPELLAITYRGSCIENIHYGWICMYDVKKGVIFKKGDINNLTYLRSTAKPIQSIPLVKNQPDISLKELAIICGSHSGSKKHVDILKKLLSKFKLSPSNLLCGIHNPLDLKSSNELVYKNKTPNVLHNNCSGKHIGMLIACKKQGWNLKNYLNPKHKLQAEIKSYIKTLSGAKKIYVATDGCSAPTFSIPIKTIAKLFANFTASNNTDYKKIIKAMTTHPYLVGGVGYIDTTIMKASKGKVLSKVGAAGLIVAAKDGKAIAVKIADGNSHIRALVIIQLLKKLKWLTKENKDLKGLTSQTIKNHRGIKVGEVEILI